MRRQVAAMAMAALGMAIMSAHVLPEADAQSHNGSGFKAVAFDLTRAPVTCPPGETARISSATTSTPSAQAPWHPLGTAFWSSYGSTLGHGSVVLSKHAADPPKLVILWGDTNATTNTFHLIGMIKSGEDKSMCGNTPELFTVDITGDCFGDKVLIRSHSPYGFNITAIEDQASAACIH